jgi:hypothetical protein
VAVRLYWSCTCSRCGDSSHVHSVHWQCIVSSCMPQCMFDVYADATTSTDGVVFTGAVEALAATLQVAAHLARAEVSLQLDSSSKVHMLP